jgi:hypothetical protein
MTFAEKALKVASAAAAKAHRPNGRNWCISRGVQQIFESPDPACMKTD